jgi:hypothetical protein
MTVTGAARAPQRAGSARRWRRTAVVALASLLLVGALVVEARSVLLFHTVAPWSSPDRIQFCGRDHHKGGAVTAAAAEDITGAAPFQQVTRGPLWQPVYAHPASAQQRAALGVPCAMVLYLPEGNGYLSYALSGGP